jgi:SAM-dependent methyltransferase
MGVTNDHNGGMTSSDSAQKRDGFAMQAAWDRASKEYLARRGNDVRFVSYGNLAPSDDELGLLGDLRSQRVLDFGCGGGQNAVACALAGAKVVAVDLSEVQLMAARRLAQAHGVTIEWRHLDGLSLSAWQGESFDLLLATQVLPYVDDPAVMLRSGRKLLRPGGRIIVSIDHPLRNCFYDTEMEELSPYPVRSYNDQAPLLWNFEVGMPMQAHHQPLGQWMAWIVEAGLHLQQLIEALAPLELCNELWPEDSPLAPLRNIPHTAILVAQAPT